MSFPLRQPKYHIKCLSIFLEPYTISILLTLVYKGVFGEFDQIPNNLKKQTNRTLRNRTNESAKELNKIKRQSQLSLESIQMSVFMFSLTYSIFYYCDSICFLNKKCSVMWFLMLLELNYF